MEDEPKKDDERSKQRVRRYSAKRLLQQTVKVPAGAEVSTEKHRGQLMVCVARLTRQN